MPQLADDPFEDIRCDKDGIAGEGKFEGSLFSHPLPGITLGCISPDARELLDQIMAAWETHYKSLKENNPPGYEPSFYGFAYWLCRWSGLITSKAIESEMGAEIEQLRKDRATLRSLIRAMWPICASALAYTEHRRTSEFRVMVESREEITPYIDAIVEVVKGEKKT